MGIENYAKTFEKLSKVLKKMKHHQTIEKTPKQPRNIITSAFFNKNGRKTGELDLQRFFEAFAKTFKIFCKDFREFRESFYSPTFQNWLAFRSTKLIYSFPIR